MQVDYDPRRISYSDLLRIFWKSHRPGQRAWKRQYMNAIFYHDEYQRKLGEETKAAVEKKMGRTVHTQVLPLRAFHQAEDYHQKYLLNRHASIAGELTRIYPRRKDFVDSTAVARVNGYVGGYGQAQQLAREIESLGLSAQGRQKLRELVRGEGKGLFN